MEFADWQASRSNDRVPKLSPGCERLLRRRIRGCLFDGPEQNHALPNKDLQSIDELSRPHGHYQRSEVQLRLEEHNICKHG